MGLLCRLYVFMFHGFQERRRVESLVSGILATGGEGKGQQVHCVDSEANTCHGCFVAHRVMELFLRKEQTYSSCER